MRGVTALAAVAMVFVSCGGRGGDHAPVPRPRAYPRVPVTEVSLHRADSLPMGFAVNDRAEVRLGGDARSRWLTIVYPAYGGVAMHLSFTLSDDPDAVAGNRLERIALNVGQAHVSVSDTLIGDGTTAVAFYRVDEPSVTPLQVLARCGRLTVSGALTGFDAAASPDSLAPILDAIQRDMLAGIDSIIITD